MKKKLTLFTTLFAGLLCIVCFVGCNAAQEQKEEIEPPQPLEVVESNCIAGSSGRGFVIMGVKNPNEKYAVGYGDFKATLKDLDGKIIKVVNVHHDYVLPAQTMYFSADCDVRGMLYGSHECDVSVGEDDWKLFTDSELIKVSDFPVSDLNKVADSHGGTHFTGKITNNTGQAQKGYRGYVLMRSAGKIVCYASIYDYKSNVANGQTSIFEASASFGGPTPQFETMEAYAYPSSSGSDLQNLIKVEPEQEEE